MSRGDTLLLTVLALIAFAANSLLARQALAADAIGPAAFTAIRLASGAIVLVLLVRGTAGNWAPLRPRGLRGPTALFLYALPFSLAYVRIGAATGALLLFGAV
ncbi:MAG: EamA family transporter, partial [Planctomycetota bacterium]